MKTVVEIMAAVLLLVSGTYIAPKVVNEFKKETIKKLNQGIPSLGSFATKLTKKV